MTKSNRVYENSQTEEPRRQAGEEGHPGREAEAVDHAGGVPQGARHRPPAYVHLAEGQAQGQQPGARMKLAAEGPQSGPRVSHLTPVGDARASFVCLALRTHVYARPDAHYLSTCPITVHSLVGSRCYTKLLACAFVQIKQRL